jgi:hypothetical protein
MKEANGESESFSFIFAKRDSNPKISLGVEATVAVAQW